MNNNLNWSDNRVVSNAGTSQNKAYKEPQMRPYTSPMMSGYDNMPDYQQQGTSPSTYQQQDTSPSVYQPTGVSPATYQQQNQTASEQGTAGTSTRSDAYAPNPIFNVPGPPSVMDPGYIPGYLKSQIGKKVRAEFVFTNLYLDKTGILKEVGYNFFVLEDNATGAMIMCDLYSARFVTSV